MGNGSLVNSRVFEMAKNFVIILFARSNSGISKFLNNSLFDGETLSCKNCKYPRTVVRGFRTSCAIPAAIRPANENFSASRSVFK